MPRATLLAGCLVILSLCLAQRGGAQAPPLYLLESTGRLLAATRTTAEPTFALTLTPTLLYRGATAGPGDGSVYLVALDRSQPTSMYVLQQVSNWRVSTVRVDALPGRVADVRMGDDGGLQYLVTHGAAGVYEVPIGGPIRTLTAFPSSLAYAYSFARDPDTGDWLLMSFATLTRVASDGRVVGSYRALPWINQRADVVTDRESTDLLMSVGSTILRLEQRFTSLSTAYIVPDRGGLGDFVTDLRFDPVTRGLLFSGFHNNFRATLGFYGVLDRAGRPVVLNTSRVNPSYDRIVTPERPLVPLTAPVRGARYDVRLRIPAAAGKPYRGRSPSGRDPAFRCRPASFRSPPIRCSSPRSRAGRPSSGCRGAWTRRAKRPWGWMSPRCRHSAARACISPR